MKKNTPIPALILSLFLSACGGEEIPGAGTPPANPKRFSTLGRASALKPKRTGKG